MDQVVDILKRRKWMFIIPFLVVFLVPAQCAPLVEQMYGWGARNCEIHFSQVRGPCQPVGGIQMPTFLPESG